VNAKQAEEKKKKEEKREKLRPREAYLVWLKDRDLSHTGQLGIGTHHQRDGFFFFFPCSQEHIDSSAQSRPGIPLLEAISSAFIT